MNVTINGQKTELTGADTLAAALKQLGYDNQSVAVALNDEFVPRSAYAQTKVNENDSLEIVAPISGG